MPDQVPQLIFQDVSLNLQVLQTSRDIFRGSYSQRLTAQDLQTLAHRMTWLMPYLTDLRVAPEFRKHYPAEFLPPGPPEGVVPVAAVSGCAVGDLALMELRVLTEADIRDLYGVSHQVLRSLEMTDLLGVDTMERFFEVQRYLTAPACADAQRAAARVGDARARYIGTMCYSTDASNMVQAALDTLAREVDKAWRWA